MSRVPVATGSTAKPPPSPILFLPLLWNKEGPGVRKCGRGAATKSAPLITSRDEALTPSLLVGILVLSKLGRA